MKKILYILILLFPFSAHAQFTWDMHMVAVSPCINPAPITGTFTVQATSSVTLSNSTNAGTWSSSNTAIATIGSATGILTGVAAGTSIISYTLLGACYATQVVTVTAAPSTIAVIAHTINYGNGNSIATSSVVNTTGATSMFVSVASYGTGAAATLTDSKGNTWVPVRTDNGSTFARNTLYYSSTAIVGTGHTFTATGSGVIYPTISTLIVSGTTNVLDQQNGTTGNSNSGTTGSVTPTTAPQIAVTSVCVADGTFSINSGFTISDQLGVIFTPVTSFGLAMAYKIKPSTTAENATWSWTMTGGVNFYGIGIMTFK